MQHQPRQSHQERSRKTPVHVRWSVTRSHYRSDISSVGSSVTTHSSGSPCLSHQLYPQCRAVARIMTLADSVKLAERSINPGMWDSHEETRTALPHYRLLESQTSNSLRSNSLTHLVLQKSSQTQKSRLPNSTSGLHLRRMEHCHSIGSFRNSGSECRSPWPTTDSRRRYAKR